MIFLNNPGLSYLTKVLSLFSESGNTKEIEYDLIYNVESEMEATLQSVNSPEQAIKLISGMIQGIILGFKLTQIKLNSNDGVQNG